MATPPAPPGVADPPASPPWPPPPAKGDDRRALLLLAVGLASLPLVLLLFLVLAAPGFLEPLTDGRVAVVGLPMVGPLVLACVGALLIAGGLAWRGRPAWLGVAVAVVWVPVGLAAVILGPAVVLIAIGLAES